MRPVSCPGSYFRLLPTTLTKDFGPLLSSSAQTTRGSTRSPSEGFDQGLGVSVGDQLPQMDTHIQIGPTGRNLLPLTVKNAGPTPAASGHAH